ncbi:MAG: DUF1499 domain-containing protein [Gemmatimonadaceae bacterium]|nr:DUF1499 domain-containing protein [Gemmatimonadaceae bacterium]
MSAFPTRRLAALLLGGVMFGCSGTRPADLGVQAGRLRPCPGTPNCVSSEAGTPAEQLVKSFPAPGGAADLERLATLVRAWPRTEVVTATPGYLHAESTSLLMRFKDDVEFRYDAASGEIHVRSASRLGKSDLGVNRKRVEGLRDQWFARFGGAR